MTLRYHTPPSQRQLRVAENIRHELAKMITEGDLNIPALETLMISVAEVRISPDLKAATAFMIFPDDQDHIKLLEIFKDNSQFIRKMLASRLQMRYAPDIRFASDESISKASKLESLLTELSKESK